MAFKYDRLYVVLDNNGGLQGLYIKKENALACIPENKRNSPREENKQGVWSYGEGAAAWRIEQRMVKDSAGIVAL